MTGNVLDWKLHDWLFPKDLSKSETVTAVTLVRKMDSIGLGMFKTVVDELPRQYQVVEYETWYDKGAIVWEHKDLGWVCTGFDVRGYDLNGRPNRFKPRVVQPLDDGHHEDTPVLTSEECAVFMDHQTWGQGRRDALALVRDYVDVTETIKQQVFNQKTPMLGIAGNPKIKRKLQSAFTKISKNTGALFLETDIRDQLQPLDMDAPFNIDSLQVYRRQLECMMLEMMGVDSREPTVKKAQTQVDEIEGNDELLNYTLADCLRARDIGREMCEDLGLHARTEITGIVRPIQQVEDKGGEDDDDNAAE